MLLRSSTMLASLIASVFAAGQADAGIFGKRNCCQTTPVVCPPCAPQTCLVPVASPLCQAELMSPCVGSTTAIMQPTTSGNMIMQTYQETYSVQVPYTESVEVNGVQTQITKMRTEQRTREVQRAESTTDVIRRLQEEIARINGRDNAQDDRLGTNDTKDTTQDGDIKKLSEKINP